MPLKKVGTVGEMEAMFPWKEEAETVTVQGRLALLGEGTFLRSKPHTKRHFKAFSTHVLKEENN